MAQPFNESMKWVNESQRISESMNQWARQQINQSVARWITESMIQRFNESMNQRISGSTIQWTNEPRVQRFKDSMNQCIFPTSSSKSASRPSFFAFWSANCARAVGSFPQSRRKLQKHRPATMPVKTQGFLSQSAFTHEFTRSRTLFPITTWWWGWHDDARLNWWCECWPWPLSVTRKFAD